MIGYLGKVFNEAKITKKAKFISLVTARLKELHPDAFEECISLCQPKINDMEMIPIVISEVLAVYPWKLENYKTILATVYWIFAPWKILQHDNKLPTGMRDLICSGLKCTHPETVSMESMHLAVYWKNPRFKEKVTELADKIYNDLDRAGYLEVGTWKTDYKVK